jgi:hypothetical protein
MSPISTPFPAYFPASSFHLCSLYSPLFGELAPNTRLVRPPLTNLRGWRGWWLTRSSPAGTPARSSPCYCPCGGMVLMYEVCPEFPVQSFLSRVPCSEFPIQSSLFRVPRPKLPAQSSSVQSSRFRVPCPRVPCPELSVQSSLFIVPLPKHSSRASCLEFPVQSSLKYDQFSCFFYIYPTSTGVLIQYQLNQLNHQAQLNQLNSVAQLRRAQLLELSGPAQLVRLSNSAQLGSLMLTRLDKLSGPAQLGR